MGCFCLAQFFVAVACSFVRSLACLFVRSVVGLFFAFFACGHKFGRRFVLSVSIFKLHVFGIVF